MEAKKLVDKPQSRPLAIIVYGVLACIGVALAYLALRGMHPIACGFALLIYVLLVVSMVRRKAFLSHVKADLPNVGLGIRIPDLGKSAICFVVAVLWTGVAGSMTSDTPAGNALAAGPSLAILGIGAFFLARGLFRRTQR